MKKWWLSLLLIMPMLCGAEEVSPVPVAVPAPVAAPEPVVTTVQEAIAVPDSTAVPETASPEVTKDSTQPKTRPTLVEKLKSQETSTPRHPAPDWSNMLLGLSVVLALIFGLAWITKRLRVRVPGMSEEMKIVEAITLGPREKLCIVVVDGKRLLLGVTQHSITLLNSCDDDKKKDESEAMFSEKIKKMLQNGTPNGR